MNQTLLHQPLQRAFRKPQRRHRGQIKAASKDTQRAKELLLWRGQQTVTASTRQAQRLVVGREIGGAAGEQIQPPLLQGGQQLLGRKEIHLGRAQFQRQRQTIEPATDRFQRRQTCGRWRKGGIEALRPFGKERHRCCQLQGRQRIALFPPHLERRPAGNEQMQPATFCQQIRH